MATALIIEDSRLQRKKIAEMLHELKIDILGESPSGLEGLKLYKELKPDLVTLDILLPELHGYEVLRAIVKESHKAEVVIVSAALNKETLRKCMFLGVKQFIAKPIDKNAFIRSVNECLGR